MGKFQKDTEKRISALQEFSDEPLTPVEYQKLRRLLEAESRMEWFWSTVWIWSRAFLITIGSIFVIKSWLGEFLAWLSGLIK